MSSLKVYVDLMSQPSRTLLLFLRLNKIPHEQKLVQIKKGEHLTPEFKDSVNRFGKIPAIVDNGLNIVESVAIVRYLSAKYPINDQWYPVKDYVKQAKVDEFLEWHHIGLRLPLSMYFQTKFIRPLLFGEAPKQSHLDMWFKKMEESLDIVENTWLNKTNYLTGDKITVADIFGLCEIDQPRMAGYEPGNGRPKLSQWMNRVRKDLEPHYSEVGKVMEMVIKKYEGNPPSDLSKL